MDQRSRSYLESNNRHAAAHDAVFGSADFMRTDRLLNDRSLFTLISEFVESLGPPSESRRFRAAQVTDMPSVSKHRGRLKTRVPWLGL